MLILTEIRECFHAEVWNRSPHLRTRLACFTCFMVISSMFAVDPGWKPCIYSQGCLCWCVWKMCNCYLPGVTQLLFPTVGSNSLAVFQEGLFFNDLKMRVAFMSTSGDLKQLAVNWKSDLHTSVRIKCVVATAWLEFWILNYCRFLKYSDAASHNLSVSHVLDQRAHNQRSFSFV